MNAHLGFAYISSKLLSLCLVTTSVSLEPRDPSAEPLSSFLSPSACVLASPTPMLRCDCNCHAGIDCGTGGLVNCFLQNKNKMSEISIKKANITYLMRDKFKPTCSIVNL